jgi:hypothetical protein
MRTVKQFSPALLERFTRQGRGTGTFESFIPWHRVSRGDPASTGRSHLLTWRQRQRELLSDGEWVGCCFIMMHSGLIDAVEQFPLKLASAAHELRAWDASCGDDIYPGTLQIANSLGIRHPKVNGDGKSANWVMTTDHLAVVPGPEGRKALVAISLKPNPLADLAKRSKELLHIEKQYWNARGVQWLLITPDLFPESVGLALRRSCPWALGAPSPEADQRVAADISNSSFRL